VGITAGSREVPGRNACDRRHAYCIIIIIIIIIIANVKVQNIFRRRNDITCSTNCEYRAAATLFIP